MDIKKIILVHFTLFFVTNFFMVKVPLILIPESIHQFGWSAMFIINFFAAFFTQIRLVDSEKFKLGDIYKFVIICIFWFMFVNWKYILFKQK